MCAVERLMRDGSPARPLIGVTGPNRGGFTAWIFSRWALARAGARAVRVTPAHPINPALLDGLLIGGGADVSEPLGDQPLSLAPPRSEVVWPRRVLDVLLAPLVLLVRVLFSTRHHGLDPERDAMELELLEHARVRDLPVLGICRGSQLMTLAEGGTLQRHVNTLYTERPELYTVLARREVVVVGDSRLHAIVRRSALLVNSLHFHAVREPGRGMRVVASEPSGVPQAVEHVARRFWLGVQWHPEYLPQQKSHQRLFVALAEAAREVAHAADDVAPDRGRLEPRG